MRKILCFLLVMLLLALTGCRAKVTVETPEQTGAETTLQTQNTEQTEPTDPVQNTQTLTPEQTLPVIPDQTQPTVPATNQPEQNQPAVPTTPPETQPKPTEGAILETTPGNNENAACKHDYKVTATKVSTCSAAGSQTYTCAKCGKSDTQTLDRLAHTFKNATCTAPKICTVCGTVEGSALGHDWNAYNYCKVCNVKKAVTGLVTYTVNVKSDENVALPNVTVSVYTTSQTQPAATAVTNQKGVATMTLESHSSYKVVVTNLPAGYEAKESYSFTSTTVSIKLKTLPVYDPLDHSRARYEVGDTIADFTLTDTDGNTYTLQELKQTQKLIILDFWYNTCEICKEEFPLFEEAMKKYADQIILLAVNPYNDMDSIRALRGELGFTFPMVTDSVKLSGGFRVTAYPTTVFIDNTGKIRKIHEGDFLKNATVTQADIDSFLNMIKAYL